MEAGAKETNSEEEAGKAAEVPELGTEPRRCGERQAPGRKMPNGDRDLPTCKRCPASHTGAPRRDAGQGRLVQELAHLPP